MVDVYPERVVRRFLAAAVIVGGALLLIGTYFNTFSALAHSLEYFGRQDPPDSGPASLSESLVGLVKALGLALSASAVPLLFFVPTIARAWRDSPVVGARALPHKHVIVTGAESYWERRFTLRFARIIAIACAATVSGFAIPYVPYNEAFPPGFIVLVSLAGYAAMAVFAGGNALLLVSALASAGVVRHSKRSLEPQITAKEPADTMGT